MASLLSLVLKPLTLFLTILNRVLAWLDFAVHNTSGYFLYIFGHGLKPQTHTRPAKTRDGKVYSPSVLVTGASEGIGLATSIRLASKGYNVYASVKDKSEFQKVRDAVERVSERDRRTHGTIHATVMDVMSRDSINACAKHIEEVLADQPDKPLVGVVNNAGCCMISPMELTPDEDVRRVFELDFWAYVAVVRAFLPLIKRNKGRFINVGSYGGYVNPPMWVTYSAVKAAIEGMTRSWRLELMPFGVGMTTIRPGWTRTTGLGPKISSAWNQYFDALDKGAVGVDSLGNVIKNDESAGAEEKKVYRPMVNKWYKLISAAAEGAAQPAEAVALSIHDALSDRFCQPYYTAGYDALLGQTVRDLVPESIYEYVVGKTFGSF